jgi:hypothetical protein
MHDLRQRHCPISTPTHSKKRVATAWLTHHAAAGRKWNAYGGITALLEDGDLLIGGAFAIKRVNIGGA